MIYIIADKGLIAARGVAAEDLAHKCLAVNLVRTMLKSPLVVDGADLATDVLHALFSLLLDDGHRETVLSTRLCRPRTSLAATHNDDVECARVLNLIIRHRVAGRTPCRACLARPAVLRRSVDVLGRNILVGCRLELVLKILGSNRLVTILSFVSKTQRRNSGSPNSRANRSRLDEVPTGSILRIHTAHPPIPSCATHCDATWSKHALHYMAGNRT